MNFLKLYTRELAVTIFIFFVLALLAMPFFVLPTFYFLSVAILGFLLLFIWFIAIYILYANKKVKRHGEVLIRVRLMDKLLKFFVLPSLFYAVVVGAIYFIKAPLLNLVILASCSVILFVILVHIRASYEKMHYISSITRVIYDAVIIMIYFLAIFVMLSLEFLGLEILYASVLLSIFLLFYKLLIDSQICWNGIVLIILSSLFMFSVTLVVKDFNMFVVTAVTTLAFYLIVSIWTIRLEGYTKWGDYFNPIIYTLMALILVFSL